VSQLADEQNIDNLAQRLKYSKAQILKGSNTHGLMGS